MKQYLYCLTAAFLLLPASLQAVPPAKNAVENEPLSSTFGLDEQDEAAVRNFRRRMASIRKRRPTVALVLSGGGAKGAATVGALRYIEQYQIPIDLVVGTSIGGLLGGLYALGYDAEYLDSLIHDIDWDMALSDKVAQIYQPYSRIRYQEKVALSVPFYYKPEDFQQYMTGDRPFETEPVGALERGKNTLRSKLQSVLHHNVMGSLPSGFVFGQNVMQLITSHTANYSDSTDFLSLPIPFACVATDLVTSKAKIWHNGSLNLALRSTMSIPGLFTPVRTNGMVLVDGGMRNNFPVNIARELGADIIIGIDLHNDSASAEEIQNLGDVLGSAMDLFANDIFERNVEALDINIHPDMTGYGMLSFNKEAVDTLDERGYKAAAQHEEEFKALRRRLGKETFKLTAPPARNLAREPLVIEDIDIVGVNEREAEYIRSHMSVKPGMMASKQQIEDDVAVIFGRGGMDQVAYELRGTEEPYRLRILCRRGPLHQFGVSARMDTEDVVSLLLNVGLNTHKVSGSSLDLTARISANPFVDLQYSYTPQHFVTLNARAALRYTNRDLWMLDGQQNLRFLLLTQELFFSNMRWSRFDVKLGLRNQYYRQYNLLNAPVPGQYEIENLSVDYPSAFVDGRVETLDNGYFPTRGVSAGLRGDLVSHVFDPARRGSFFGLVQADGLFPVSFGRFSLLPQGTLRFVMGPNVPLMFANVLGGDIRSRYFEQQFPFVGSSKAIVMDNYMAMLRLDARYRFGSSHYVSLMGNAVYDFPNFAGFTQGRIGWGVGGGYAYDSILGPVKGQIFWSSLTRRVGFYLSAGFYF